MPRRYRDPRHSAAQAFKTATGVQLVHVPNKGAPQAIVSLIANETSTGKKHEGRRPGAGSPCRRGRPLHLDTIAGGG